MRLCSSPNGTDATDTEVSVTLAARGRPRSQAGTLAYPSIRLMISDATQTVPAEMIRLAVARFVASGTSCTLQTRWTA